MSTRTRTALRRAAVTVAAAGTVAGTALGGGTGAAAQGTADDDGVLPGPVQVAPPPTPLPAVLDGADCPACGLG